jgi:ribose transport system substrate-binding protein
MATRWLIGSAVLLVAAVVAATGGAVAHSATNLPAATANLDNYDAAPAWVAPGPSFDAKKASGKTIFVIPGGTEALMLPSVSVMVGGIRQAAATVGVRTLSCSNSGSDADWNACFKQAIAKKVSAIVIAGGTPPASVASMVTIATAAGIKVIAGHVPNPSDFTGAIAAAYTKSEAGLTAIVPAPYGAIGQLLADGLVVQRPAPARIVIVTSSDIPASAGLQSAATNELTAVCGSDCPIVNTLDLPYATWQTNAIGASAQNLLAAPVTAYIVLFDKVDALLAEGNHDARLASATSTQPRIIGYGGAPFAIELGQDNNRVEGDVAENMNWLGWATMDQTLRVLTGTKTVRDENTGLRFVDDDAWGAEGVGPEGWSFPPLLDQGWGDPRGDDGWITGYTKLWGVPIKSDGYQLSGGSSGGDDD